MKLQNLFIKSKIKELTKKHPSKWNNSNVYQLFFYSNAEEFKKYKKILIILYNEFLIEIENNIRSKELTLNLENLKEMQTYLQLDEKINLKNKIDELEKNKLEQLQKDKINIDNTNNTDNKDITENINNENNVPNDINIRAEKKIYINNLNDAELFTIDEIMQVSDFKYYLEIFFGIILVIFIFMLKNLFKVSNKFIEKDFCSVHTYTTDDIKALKDKFLNNKILKYLLGDEIKIELKDIL
jgi:hypothetical protein